MNVSKFFLVGITEFPEWLTIPQVYFKGEFIDGCDILLNMHQSGDLERTHTGRKGQKCLQEIL